MEKNIKTMNLRDLLEAGYTSDEIIKNIQNELQTIQEAIDAQNRSTKAEIKEKRDKFIDAFFDYVRSVSNCDNEDVDQLFRSMMNSTCDELEQNFEKAGSRKNDDLLDFLTDMILRKSPF